MLQPLQVRLKGARDRLQLALNVGSLHAAMFPESEVDRTRPGHRENGALDPIRSLPGNFA